MGEEILQWRQHRNHSLEWNSILRLHLSMLLRIPTIKAGVWARLVGRGNITTKRRPWPWAWEGSWTAPSALLPLPGTAACHPLPWAQGRSSHMHDNTNLAQATIAVWHTEIENYNSAQQSQFEQCTEEFPIIYNSRVSPFLGFEKIIRK